LLRAEKIPDNVTAGGATVGVRWPGHPFMQAVIRECGFPLAAPSANLSNQISSTNAEHVRAQLVTRRGSVRDFLDRDAVPRWNLPGAAPAIDCLVRLAAFLGDGSFRTGRNHRSSHGVFRVGSNLHVRHAYY